MFDFMAHESTEFGLSAQPFLVDSYKYRPDMDDPDLDAVLWRNLQLLMRRDALTKAALADRAKVGAATMTRIAAGGNSTGIDKLEGLGRALKVKPWQLLAPGLGAELHIVKGGSILPVFDLSTIPEGTEKPLGADTKLTRKMPRTLAGGSGTQGSLHRGRAQKDAIAKDAAASKPKPPKPRK